MSKEIDSEFMSSLISVDGIPLKDVKNLEKRILYVGNKEEISASKRSFVDWAFLVHDFNRMHVFSEYASEAGFKKTPMHGTRIAAFQEQYVLAVKGVLEEFLEKELYYNNHRIKFESPIFPGFIGGANAKWESESLVINEEGIKLKILATDGKQEKYLSSNVSLGYKRVEKTDQDVIKFLSSNDLVHKTRMEIKSGEIENYYELLNKKVDNKDLIVSLMHPAAFVPATLLELSSRRTGRPEGAYRQIDFEFYNPPQAGIFETSLKMLSQKEMVDEKTGQKAYAYRFEALSLQEGKPILSGRINCISPSEYKFAA